MREAGVLFPPTPVLRQVTELDDLLIMRPTGIASTAYAPLPARAEVGLGGWSADDFAAAQERAVQPVAISMSTDPGASSGRCAPLLACWFVRTPAPGTLLRCCSLLSGPAER